MNTCTLKNSLVRLEAREHNTDSLQPTVCSPPESINWPSGESHKGRAARHISTAACLPTAAQRLRRDLFLSEKNPPNTSANPSVRLRTRLAVRMQIPPPRRRFDMRPRLLVVNYKHTTDAGNRFPRWANRQPETVIKPRRFKLRRQRNGGVIKLSADAAGGATTHKQKSNNCHYGGDETGAVPKAALRLCQTEPVCPTVLVSTE